MNEEIESLKESGEIHTVSSLIRFLNVLIDSLCFSAIYNLVVVGFSVIHLKIPPAYTLDHPNSKDLSDLLKMHMNLVGYLILNSLNFLYYFLMESTRGQTFGKILTQTIVVNRYDEKPGMGEIALRTLCRFIPFEFFSFLYNGIGWHDRISQTYVRPARITKEDY